MMLEKIKVFKSLLVKKFREHYDFGLFTLNYHLHNHMVGDIRRFGTLFILGSCQFRHFIVHIYPQYRKRTSQRGRTKMMETVRVLDGGSERMLPQEKEDITGIVSRTLERVACMDCDGPFWFVMEPQLD